MSRLSKLIEELCPEGVEWKKLGDIAKRLKGTPITATLMKQISSEDGEIRIFAGGKTMINAHLEDIPNANITYRPALLVQSRGVIDFVYYDKPFTFKNEMWAYTMDDTTSIKFLYYYLKDKVNYFRDKAVSMGAFPQISLPITDNFEIPVPPLPVQEEIVRILDKFTTLEAELEAELDCRKRQYEFYRNKLLTFSKIGGISYEVRQITLGDIGEVCMCKRIMKHQTNTTGGIPFYKIGTFGGETDAYIDRELYEEYKSKFSFPKKGDVLISAAGTIGRAVIYDGTDSYYQDSNIVWINNDERIMLNKYLFYLYSIIEWKTEGGTIKRLYNGNLKATKVAVPPLSEQQRIVSILDRFEALTTDLQSGLPAEIEARRKQYEYYRERLLTFNKEK